jgi:hypothetical protein
MASTGSYTGSEIDRLRNQLSDSRRHLFWAIPSLITVALISFHGGGGWIFLAIVTSFIGLRVYMSPGIKVKAYDSAHGAWNTLLERSHPNAILNVNFALQENERVYYSEQAMRFEERRTGQVIDTQSRTKNAVGSAVLGGVLFGPAGAIVGGSMARRRTTGTATDVYNVVPVDHGTLAITNNRAVFMGSRDTIEVLASRIMRYSAIEGSDRINVEYPGRAPGESYSVNPSLFNLCMVRRAKDGRFALPVPPPPLSIDVNDPIALDSSLPNRVLQA